MISIMNNTWKIFKRNKEFIYLITIQPVIIFLLMSFLLPYSTAHNIAVINQNAGSVGNDVEQALEQLEGVKLIDVKADQVNSKLMAGNIEIAVMVAADGSASLVSLGNSEIESAVSLCVSQAVASADDSPVSDGIPVEVNAVSKKGISISNSLSFMIFKTLTTSNLLAALIIAERNNKMKDRILLSRTGTVAYLGGRSLVYLFLTMLGTIVYYLAALLMNFDFGMRNSLGFLMVVFTANVLSVTLYLFASTLVKKEDALWFMASFVLLPMALFSGVLFPYEFMPKVMQMVGAFCPQRWIVRGIEAIQETGTLTSAALDMALVLGLSAVLFILTVIRSGPQKQRAD